MFTLSADSEFSDDVFFFNWDTRTLSSSIALAWNTEHRHEELVAVDSQSGKSIVLKQQKKFFRNIEKVKNYTVLCSAFQKSKSNSI